MSRKSTLNPYQAALESSRYRGGSVSTRFPPPNRVRTGLVFNLATGLHPEGMDFPVVLQTDLEAATDNGPQLHVYRQNQWIGGMGQRIMADATKFQVAAAHTLTQDGIMPQPRAIPVTTESAGGYDRGEYIGRPERILEWQGAGANPTKRRIYMATYTTTGGIVTRVYQLSYNGLNASNLPKYGWVLWKAFTNWRYSDFVITQTSAGTPELRILGVADGLLPTDPLCHYWKASVCNLLAADWTQGDQTQTHQCFTPDGDYYSYQSTFYYPTGSVKVGANDTGNYINNIVLVNGVIVIIKPDGVYTYTKSGNLCQLKVNLRTYFDTNTGMQACQWGQMLYFNLGKQIAAFDGDKIVFLPPVYDWAEPSWLPEARCLVNCGEALGVAFDGRAALFDGQDWHNLWREGGINQMFFTTAYKETDDHHMLNLAGQSITLPIIITASVTPKTHIFEFYPAFFRPVAAQRSDSADVLSWLIGSAFVSDNDTELICREFVVRGRNFDANSVLQAGARTRLGVGVDDGFTDLPFASHEVINGEDIFHFTVPSPVETGHVWQYMVRFYLNPCNYPTTIENIPTITEISLDVRTTPANKKRRWDVQFLCMDDYEFPDGTPSQWLASDMEKCLLEGEAQKSPVTVGKLQPATSDADECWVYFPAHIKVIAHVPYLDESTPTGYICQVRIDEI